MRSYQKATTPAGESFWKGSTHACVSLPEKLFTRQREFTEREEVPTRALLVEKPGTLLVSRVRDPCCCTDRVCARRPRFKLGRRGSFPERTVEQTVDGTVPKANLSESPEAGSSWLEANDTISTSSTTTAKSVGEAQPPRLAKKWSASTESELAKFSGESGSSWSRANGTTNATATAVEKSAGDARSPGIAKCSATTEFVLVKSSGEAGTSCTAATGTTSVSLPAVEEYVGEARPPGIAKCSATDVDEILEAIKDIPLEVIFEGFAKEILALPMEP